MRERCSLPRYCAGLGHRFLSKRRALENSRLYAVHPDVPNVIGDARYGPRGSRQPLTLHKW